MSESVDSLKQRLVGAFVILSLAVIFLPMLFDKPHRERAAELELVPPKPELERVVISKPKQLESKKVLQSDQDKPLDQAAVKTKTQAPVTSSKVESRPKVVSAQKPLLSSDEQSTEVKAPKAVNVTPKKKEGNKSSKSKVYNNVWMVQLGTFSKSENAYALRDRLRSKGIDGHTKSLNSGKAVRVFAGPFVTKKEALRIKRKVDAEFSLDSLVVFFEA